MKQTPKRYLLLFLLAWYCLLPALSYDVEVDGVFYNFMGTRRASVTHAGLQQDVPAYRGEVTIPESITVAGRTYSVTSVGESAFAGCDGLTIVRLPSTLRAISGCAFIGCSSLRQVDVPTTLEAIAPSAFTGCVSLQQVDLPRHAETVEPLSLYCCAALQHLALPFTVRTVCQDALAHLPALTDLSCFAEEPPTLEPGAFTSADLRHVTLRVPAASIGRYRQAPVWCDFAHIEPLSDDAYTAQGYRRGDLNDDGSVDAADYELMRRLLVGLPAGSILSWAADLNGDGKVNAQDLVLICQQVSAAR